MKASLELIVADTPEACAKRSAKEVVLALEGVIRPTILLPTGSSPQAMYEELLKYKNEQALDWQGSKIFALDEYLGLAPEDPNSFRSQLWREIASPMGLGVEQLITPDGLSSDPEAEALKYESLLDQNSPISLAVVGVGRNGHVAFNEPGTPFSSSTHVATLSPETIEDNSRAFTSGSVPPRAITIGLATLLKPVKIIVVAQGERKADAISALLRGVLDPEWPITSLIGHGNVTIVIDSSCNEGLNP